ncbi:MAG TPA: hypothetical protein VF458_22570 [Ktedonobacteraceae bacterium]
MIDPHWELVDLDAVTWRQLGRFFDPGQYLRAAQPGEHGLFLLHECGKVLRVVDSKTGVRSDLAPASLDDPQECARQLYARGEWQRVHVIDKAHLALVARVAQETPRCELTLDAYYHQVYQLLWGTASGYVSIPPHPGHWHGWTYQQVSQWVNALPFSPATLALGVLDRGCWQIGLILLCEQGRIRKITTFESLDLQALACGLSEETLTALSQQLTDTVAPPAGLLLCTRAVFDAWIEQENKTAVLLNAHQQRQAYWHWQR